MTVKYVITTTADNTAELYDIYGGMDFAGFKVQYETDHPGKVIVEVGDSVFPAGQDWYSGDGPYQRLPKPGGSTFEYIQTNIIKNIVARTELIEYEGFVTFKSKQFPRDHETRDDVVLLACTSSVSPAIAAEMLPLRVNAIDFSEVTIANTTEALDFALAMLGPTKEVYADQADQIAAVKAITTIAGLVQYVDPR